MGVKKGWVPKLVANFVIRTGSINSTHLNRNQSTIKGNSNVWLPCEAV